MAKPRNTPEARHDAPLPGPDSDEQARLADALPAFISIVDREQRFRLVNRAYEEWFGVPRQELLGKTIREVVGEEPYAARKASIEAALAGERVRIETFTPKPDGSLRDTEIQYVPRFDVDGRPDGFYVLGTDITERKQTQEALRESEERYRLAVKAFHGAPYESYLDTGYGYRDPRAYEMLGFAPEEAEATREWWFRRVHPDELPRLQAALDELFDERRSELDVEYRMRHRDGHWVWLWQRGLLLKDAQGRPQRLYGALLDITERRETEAALRDSELLKSAILVSALDCIITIDQASRVVEWNPASERTFGYAREEALGRDLAQLIVPPELRDSHYRGMAAYLSTESASVIGRRVEVVGMRADGSLFPVELAINPIVLAGRQLFTAYLRDLTASKQAEAALRESDQRLRATYEQAFAGIAEVDRDGRFLRVNEQFAAITGYDRDELLQLSFADLTHPEDRDPDVERFRRQMAGEIGTYTAEKRYLHKSGHIVWIELSASRVDDASGRPLYGIRVVRDISERRRAERRQRLLIAELNHRVKNTLATVQSIASQSLRNAETPQDARMAVEARLMSLARAHDVLTRESWAGAGLREIIAEALAPYRDAGGNRFLIEGPEVRLPARAALSLSMVLHELLTNALKYGALSNASGRVEIGWSLDRSAEPPRLHMQWTERDGPPVELPTRRGFGSRLIERSLKLDLGGLSRIDFAASGLACRLELPIAEADV